MIVFGVDLHPRQESRRSSILTAVNLLDLLYIPVGIATAPLWMRKRRAGWSERFGHVSGMFDESAIEPDRPRVLLHAVSVGEINALRALVPILADSVHVFVSATTDTGLARAGSLYGQMGHVSVVRYPLDCSWMVSRFLDLTRPDVVGLVELEVWPNFIKACAKRGIPIGLINGRLSARSFRGYRKIRFLLRPTFDRLAFACVQDADYAERIRAMGVPDDRIEITGSMKWDSLDAGERGEPSPDAMKIAAELGVDLGRPVVVGGSTAEGEEALIDRAVGDAAQVIVAPRKVERFDEAAAAMPGCVRRSTGQTRGGASRFLLDTIGELSAVYELGDVVVMGRSFGDLFGSDPIEPAALGKPVLIGPRHSDFSVAVGLLREAGGLRVVEREELGESVRSLLADREARSRMGDAGRRCVLAQQGASGRHARVLLERGGLRESGSTDAG